MSKKVFLFLIVIMVLLCASCGRVIEGEIYSNLPVPDRSDAKKDDSKVEKEKSIGLYIGSYDAAFIQSLKGGMEKAGISRVDTVESALEFESFDYILADESTMGSVENKDKMLLLENYYSKDSVYEDVVLGVKKDLGNRQIKELKVFVSDKMQKKESETLKELCDKNAVAFATSGTGAEELALLFEQGKEGFSFVAINEEEALAVRDKMIDSIMQDKVSIVCLEWTEEIEKNIRKVLIYGAVIGNPELIGESIGKSVLGTQGDIAGYSFVNRENIDSDEIRSIRYKWNSIT